MLTFERTRAVLDYDRDTGIFRWRSRSVDQFMDGGHCAAHNARKWNARYAGAEAGKVDGRNGYRYISIDGVRYAAHRLALFIETGCWPADEVDHIDGNTSNNAIPNLRAVSRAQNARNMPMNSRNTSGVVGVGVCSSTGRWLAQIGANGRVFHLGRFDKLADAVAARKSAEQKYGFHTNHGRPRNVSA